MDALTYSKNANNRFTSLSEKLASLTEKYNMSTLNKLRRVTKSVLENLRFFAPVGPEIKSEKGRLTEEHGKPTHVGDGS